MDYRSRNQQRAWVLPYIVLAAQPDETPNNWLGRSYGPVKDLYENLISDNRSGINMKEPLHEIERVLMNPLEIQYNN